MLGNEVVNGFRHQVPDVAACSATRAQFAGGNRKQGDIEKKHPTGAFIMEFFHPLSLRIRNQFVKRGVVARLSGGT